MHSEFAVQAAQDPRSARSATNLALTLLGIFRQLIEEVEAMVVTREGDGGQREGALDMDGEPAAGLLAEEAEAVALGAGAGGAGEVGRDVAGDERVGRVGGVVEDFFGEEARVVDVKAALLAAISHAGALVVADRALGLPKVGPAADHQVVPVAEVLVPHDPPGLMSAKQSGGRGWILQTKIHQSDYYYPRHFT